MGIFQHVLLNCSGRSFTEDVIVVGGASLNDSVVEADLLLSLCFSLIYNFTSNFNILRDHSLSVVSL